MGTQRGEADRNTRHVHGGSAPLEPPRRHRSPGRLSRQARDSLAPAQRRSSPSLRYSPAQEPADRSATRPPCCPPGSRQRLPPAAPQHLGLEAAGGAGPGRGGWQPGAALHSPNQPRPCAPAPAPGKPPSRRRRHRRAAVAIWWRTGSAGRRCPPSPRGARRCPGTARHSPRAGGAAPGAARQPVGCIAPFCLENRSAADGRGRAAGGHRPAAAWQERSQRTALEPRHSREKVVERQIWGFGPRWLCVYYRCVCTYTFTRWFFHPPAGLRAHAAAPPPISGWGARGAFREHPGFSFL